MFSEGRERVHWEEMGQPMSYEYYIPITPENVKPEFSDVFGGYRNEALKCVSMTYMDTFNKYLASPRFARTFA